MMFNIPQSLHVDVHRTNPDMYNYTMLVLLKKDNLFILQYNFVVHMCLKVSAWFYHLIL